MFVHPTKLFNYNLSHAKFFHFFYKIFYYFHCVWWEHRDRYIWLGLKKSEGLRLNRVGFDRGLRSNWGREAIPAPTPPRYSPTPTRYSISLARALSCSLSLVQTQPNPNYTRSLSLLFSLILMEINGNLPRVPLPTLYMIQPNIAPGNLASFFNQKLKMTIMPLPLSFCEIQIMSQIVHPLSYMIN